MDLHQRERPEDRSHAECRAPAWPADCGLFGRPARWLANSPQMAVPLRLESREVPGEALLLGSAGVYGVMSHAVSRRTHEIGVRLALGADYADITAMIVGRGLLLVGVGEAAGLGAALALNRVIASMLVHVA